MLTCCLGRAYGDVERDEAEEIIRGRDVDDLDRFLLNVFVDSISAAPYVRNECSVSACACCLDARIFASSNSGPVLNWRIERSRCRGVLGEVA